MTSDDKPDMVNHPGHYTWHPTGVECIDINEWFPANIAAAMKYLWRVDDKGDHIENLEKAAFYINREITRRKSDEYHAWQNRNHDPANTGEEAWDAFVGFIRLWENNAGRDRPREEVINKLRPRWAEFVRQFYRNRRDSNS